MGTSNDFIISSSAIGFGFFLILAIIGSILLLIAAAVVTAIVISNRNKKYRTFVLTHSVAIKKIKELNKKYSFVKIANFDMKNTYDNNDFYPTISCLDYLIYELNYKQKEVRNAIKGIETNKSLLPEYNSEAASIKKGTGKYNVDVLSFNKDKLDKMEIQEFNRLVIKPKTTLSITVVLRRFDMGDNFQERKSKTFNMKEIQTVLDRLQNKRGNFYQDEEIWNSICRVERGKVSHKLRFLIYKRDNNRCRICGSTNNLEIDHIYPISKGGKSTPDNLQTLCHRCNVKKGANIVS